jgi:predicted site-specific integrase-resolvase
MDMKLSQYAKQAGVTYKTAWRWWKAGRLDAEQTPTGTVIVRDPHTAVVSHGRVALYARVSSADQKDDLARQVQRLRDYAAARGYQVSKVVTEIASGLNDRRPKLAKLLVDLTIGTLIVEHRDRLTRFGFAYIEQLFLAQGRQIEVLVPSDSDDELVDDFVAVITNMAARIYGRRNSKRRAERIQACVKHCVEAEDEA